MRNKIIYNGVTYPDVKISTGTIFKETSLQIGKLAIDSFEVEVKSKDPTIVDFNQNAPLDYYYKDVKRDVYYVQDITRVSPDHYVISCISALGRLAQRDHLGGIYTGETVDEVVAEICGDIPYIIKSNLLGIKIYNWLPIANARDNMRELLFAIGANLWQDHNGVLRISELWDGLASVIDSDRVYTDGASAKTDKPVTQVTILEHQYIPGKERRDLFTGITSQGQRIPFDGPMSALEADGFTILSSGANYAVVSSGSGKITGCPYVHTALEVTRNISDAPVKNEIRIETATLVSLVNSSAVADRVAKYYACRDTIQVDAVLRQEHPGEVVQIIHPYDRTMVKAAISACDASLSATIKGSLTALVNFTPDQTGNAVTYEHHEVITQSGSWTVPEGCYKVRAVLIGGGEKGGDGEAGTAGGSGGANRGGAAGQSGSAGPGGSGGKIFDVTIDVTPGQVLPVSIGVGGTQTMVPGETSFGGHSSAEGDRSPIGYTDLVDGITYATPGEMGEVAPSHTAGTSSGRELRASFTESIPAHGLFRTESLIVGSAGRAGSDGAYATASGGWQQSYTGEGTVLTVYFDVSYHAVAGYDGISPPDRDPASVPGCGGDGGHGGGGGAGAGGYSPSVRSGSKIYSYTSTGGTTSNWVVRNVIEGTAAGGKGGSGSKGAPGASGVLLLYYGTVVEKTAGAFVTAQKNFFVDKTGRMFIV